MLVSFRAHLLTSLKQLVLDPAEPDDNLQKDSDPPLIRSSKDLRGRSRPDRLSAVKEADPSERQESHSKAEQPGFGDPDRDPEVGVSTEDEGQDTDDEDLQRRISGSARVSSSEPSSEYLSYDSRK